MERAQHVANVDWSRFVSLDDEDRRELVDGVLMEVEVPNRAHEWIVAQFIVHLTLWASRRGLAVLGSGYKVRISHRRGAMPDVQVLSAETFASVENELGLVRGRPEIAVEVISPTSRGHDRVRKLGWYASIGVPEYWIVDPDARTLERCVLDDGVYSVREAAEGNVTFRPKGLRGLSIPLGAIWAKLPSRRRR